MCSHDWKKHFAINDLDAETLDACTIANTQACTSKRTVRLML
jgi:hypothetical protein